MGIEHGYETTPFSLFWEGSFHSGVWNSPYTLHSVSGISGYVLGKVYNYYDTYYSTATAEVGGTGTAPSSAVKTKTTPPISGTNNGDVNNRKDESESSSSSSSSSLSSLSSSIVDVVPSTFGEPMPDLVRERLEILS